MSFRTQNTVARVRKKSGPEKKPALIQVYSPSALLAEPKTSVIGTASLHVGRDVPDDGLLLEDPAASRDHFIVEIQAGNATLLDRSTHGTRVNGKPQLRAVLADCDVIRAGDSFFVFRFLPPAIQDAAVADFVGVSPIARELRHKVALVAPSDARVLILGQSGTGKEVIAKALHDLSGVKGRFIAVNCAAIPESLAESQLFGHLAGAFTGARKDSNGLFKDADGGTLFLDEVGELSPAIQAKLLRVLETGEVTPVGASATRKVHVRVLAATLRNLREHVHDGRFREDLYARLSDITIQTPPLAERKEDILLLLQLALGERPIEPDLAEAMLSHHWPLNVRELFKVAKELEVVGQGLAELPLDLIEHRFEETRPTQELSRLPPAPTSSPLATPEAPVKVTRELMVELLTQSDGMIAKVARELGRSRKQVYRYLEEFDLDLSEYRN